MANLNETARWEAGIYQFETSDPVMGGPNGIDNRPTRELANRTLWLKTELAKAVQNIGTLQGISITAGAGLAGGGNLSASRSLTLATPSTLSGNTNNWAGNGATGHTHELAKATATLAGVVKLIDNLTAGGRDAALSAEQGKVLKNALDEKLAKQGDQTLDGALTVTGTLTAGKTEYWGKLRFNALDGGYWVIETPPAGEADKRLNIKFTKNKATATLSFPDIGGGQTVAYQGWVSQQAQAVRTALKNEILGGAGAAFDTLKEFQTALGDDADFAATTAGRLAEAAPSGMIAYFAGQTAPAGWLKANGAAVSRTAYDKLFAAVGTSYGAGDGKTTFNLPDLRGEFLRGWDDGRGIDTGRVFGSAQADEFRAHNHVTNINADIPTYGSETGDSVGTEDVSRADDRTVRATTGMRGGAETRPRNIALLACIKI